MAKGPRKTVAANTEGQAQGIAVDVSDIPGRMSDAEGDIDTLSARLARLERQMSRLRVETGRSRLKKP